MKHKSVAGIVLLTRPFASAKAILTFFGVILSIYGIGEMVWSIRIRQAKKKNPDKGSEIVDTDYEEINE